MKSALEEVIENIKNSPKYRSIDEELIRSIGQEQLERRKSLKEAIKFTRAKLHQVGAVYFDRKIDYKHWMYKLSISDKKHIPDLCRTIMSTHSSTRERLPILEAFYEKIFSQLPPIHSILDIACGLNPLAIPWMKLGDQVNYFAYDIYQDLAIFLNQFFSILDVSGKAYTCDILRNPPIQNADLALILKAIPCLEQLRSDAGTTLLENTPAQYLVVSFPVKSLSGKQKGMLTYYDDYFQTITNGKGWTVSKIVFSEELVYIVKK